MHICMHTPTYMYMYMYIYLGFETRTMWMVRNYYETELSEHKLEDMSAVHFSGSVSGQMLTYEN